MEDEVKMACIAWRFLGDTTLEEVLWRCQRGLIQHALCGLGCNMRIEPEDLQQDEEQSSKD